MWLKGKTLSEGSLCRKLVAQALSVLFQNVKHDDFLWYHELMT